MLKGLSEFIKTSSKVSAPYLLAVSLATGLLLFGPEWFVAPLHLSSVVSQYGPFIGVIFLASSSYLLALFIWTTRDFAQAKYKGAKAAKKRLAHLRSLTPEEQRYLVPYIDDDTNTQLFPLEDGVIGGLELKGCVFRSSNVFDMVDGVPWNIQPWTRDQLKKSPELLEAGRKLIAKEGRRRRRAV